MEANLSNNLKVVLFVGDFIEHKQIIRTSCYTVQSYDYDFYRNRTDLGIPFGQTIKPFVKISIKTLPKSISKMFYERLKLNDVFSFSLIFNAKYDDNKQLSNYDEAMIVSGYVVSVSENFKSRESKESSDRMLMDITIMVRTIKFVDSYGENKLSLM